MPVRYEWDIETRTKVGREWEVDSHDHRDRLRDFDPDDLRPILAASPGERVLVLVRDDDEGRAWAYVDQGALDPYFYDAHGGIVRTVPKRFAAELARVARSVGELVREGA